MAYNKPSFASKYYPTFYTTPRSDWKDLCHHWNNKRYRKDCSPYHRVKRWTVIMLNRASSRSEKAQQDIATAYPDVDVQTVECDLQSFASVQSAADQLRMMVALMESTPSSTMPESWRCQTRPPSTVLIPKCKPITSHFLLTRELFPLLEKGATHMERHLSHRESCLSIARKSVWKLKAKYLERNGGNLGGDSLGITGGGRWVRYGQTKLANAAFTAALHEKLQAKESKVKALVAPRLGKYRTAHEYRQARRTVHRSVGVFLAKTFFSKRRRWCTQPVKLRHPTQCSIGRLLGSWVESHRIQRKCQSLRLRKAVQQSRNERTPLEQKY